MLLYIMVIVYVVLFVWDWFGCMYVGCWLLIK